MAKKIDWMYDRKNCETCKKSRGYLETTPIEVAEKVDATKTRIAPDEALKLLDGMEKLIAMKGKKVVEFDLTAEMPSDEVLTAHLIGPSGNLRAPTIKIGKTMVVGFNEEAYQHIFGNA